MRRHLRARRRLVPQVELFEHRRLLAAFVVNSSADTDTGNGTAGTLRYVINQLDNSADSSNTISFAITSASTSTQVAISIVAQPLPPITTPVELDGGGAVILDGSQLTSTTASKGAIDLETGSQGSSITGMTIENFSVPGIYLNSAGNQVTDNTLESNQRGLVINSNQNTVAGNTLESNQQGLVINSNQNTVGGVTSADSNTISGNTSGNIQVGGNNPPNAGILINGSDNLIEGNYIGAVHDQTYTQIAGQPSSNYIGVDVAGGAAGNTIGGPAGAGGNYIAGNTYAGIDIHGTGTRVQGNDIGVVPAASASLNYLTLIPGTIFDFNPLMYTLTLVSDLSFTETGDQPFGNGTGVRIEPGAAGNVIGGADGNLQSPNSGLAPGLGNVISANTTGIDCFGSQNTLEGNLIGTDETGHLSAATTELDITFNLYDLNPLYPITPPITTPPITSTVTPPQIIPSSFSNSIGVNIEPGANSNTIGGEANLLAASPTGNLISNSIIAGISISGDDTSVLGNFIGSNIQGDALSYSLVNGQRQLDSSYKLGNRDGVLIQAGATGNSIGGLSTSSLAGGLGNAANLICGNYNSGVSIFASFNDVQGDVIGADLAENTNSGNLTGIIIGPLATENLIGVDASQPPPSEGPRALGNNISGNLITGVEISGIRNTVSGNDIGWRFSTSTPGTYDSLSNGIGVSVRIGSVAYGSENPENVIGGKSSSSLKNPAGLMNVISGNAISGISLNGLGTLVAGNRIGTDPSGMVAIPNAVGVTLAAVAPLKNSSGDVPADQNQVENNTISGNTGIGVDVFGTANYLEDNFIGTNSTGMPATGSTGIGNRTGVYFESGATGNFAIGNLISGNVNAGIDISGNSNVLQGNNIGTNQSGTAALSNSVGVRLDPGATGNLIGGLTEADSNVISGNFAAGVEINSNSNQVLDNDIGLNATGTAALGNSIGVSIDQAVSYNEVAENVISGNLSAGVQIQGNTNWIAGNLIGTDLTGMNAIGNGAGVVIQAGATGNVVGTGFTEEQLTQYFAGSLIPPSWAPNTISGNTAAGVDLSGAGSGPGEFTQNNIIAGNLIGTNVTGDGSVPNGDGVLLESGAQHNIIGGVTTSRLNVISGNATAGVLFTGSATSFNTVVGNEIGTDPAGTDALGNAVGIFVLGARSNLIGGTAGAPNVISGNHVAGVEIQDTGATSTTVSDNFIGPVFSGTQALPATSPYDPAYQGQATGVLINGSVANTIGGGNVISGNQVGVEISGISSGSAGRNTIVGNFIGIGANQKPVGNQAGIYLNNVPNTQVGLPGEGNYISANVEMGIAIVGTAAQGNLIQANVIGLGPDGESYFAGVTQGSLNPDPIGIYIQYASNNVIGGLAAGGIVAGNTISGNNAAIYILGQDGSSAINQIQGNLIGTLANGASEKWTGNASYGVLLFNAPANSVPMSGRGKLVNKIVGSGIANLREYSGPTSGLATASSTHGSKKTSAKMTHRDAKKTR